MNCFFYKIAIYRNLSANRRATASLYQSLTVPYIRVTLFTASTPGSLTDDGGNALTS